MNEVEFNELLNWLAETPAVLNRGIRGLSDSQLRERPAAEEFSLVEQICHLRDIDVDGYSVRIDRILTEDHPHLPDLDGTRLAIERDYQSQDPVAALNEFTAARNANVERLREITAGQLDRSGQLEGTGSVTLARLVQMLGEHDSIHRDEVAAIRSGFANDPLTASSGSATAG